MIASILILGVSSVLLVYWFRYTCILLLRNSQGVLKNPTLEDARLSYRRVQAELESDAQAPLESLHAALNRDYQLLTYLLEHAAALDLNPVEQRLLSLDYQVMRIWFRLTRSASPARARKALEEMASVVGFFARRMSERAMQSQS